MDDMSNMALPHGNTSDAAPIEQEPGASGKCSGPDERRDNLTEVVVGQEQICECPCCGTRFKIRNITETSPRMPLRCKRCGFEWMSKKGEPRKCPKCGSSSWDKPTTRCTCNVCGYSWTSRKSGGPSRCPKCGSYAWDKPSTECLCMVCGYSWTSRKQGGPSKCPNCKSNRWDEVPGKKNTLVREKNAEDVTRKWVLEKYDVGKGCMEIATQLGIPLLTVMSIVKEDRKSPVFPRL